MTSSNFQGAQGHSRQSRGLLAQTSEPGPPSVLRRGSWAAETGTVSRCQNITEEKQIFAIPACYHCFLESFPCVSASSLTKNVHPGMRELPWSLWCWLWARGGARPLARAMQTQQPPCFSHSVSFFGLFGTCPGWGRGVPARGGRGGLWGPCQPKPF